MRVGLGASEPARALEAHREADLRNPPHPPRCSASWPARHEGLARSHLRARQARQGPRRYPSSRRCRSPTTDGKFAHEGSSSRSRTAVFRATSRTTFASCAGWCSPDVGAAGGPRFGRSTARACSSQHAAPRRTPDALTSASLFLSHGNCLVPPVLHPGRSRDRREGFCRPTRHAASVDALRA